MTATSPAFAHQIRTATLTVLVLLLSVVTLLGTGQTASAMSPPAVDPEQPVLVSAGVIRVLNPVQTPTTYQWSSIRRYGTLRSVWDLPEGTETETFSAATGLGSTKFCGDYGCVGSSDFHLLMPSPGEGKYATCARSVAGQRLTLDCPITMRKFQETGDYVAGIIVASWHRTVDGVRTSGQAEVETRVTARIRNATRILASVRSVATASGARTRLVGTVQVLKVTATSTGYAARWVKNRSQKVAVTFQAPGGTERSVSTPSLSSTGFAATYPYRSSGTWRIRYAGGSATAPSWATRAARPLYQP